MNSSSVIHLRKTLLSTAVAAAISSGSVSVSYADIYEFTYDNGGCTPLPAPAGSCTGPGDGLFTMLDPGGVVLQNTSYPYYGDITWGYGLRTQMGGTLTLDPVTGLGTATVNPFEFFNKGPATASGIQMKAVPAGSLWIANMGFNWNLSDITTQVVWDMAGLLAALPTTTTITDVIDQASCTGGLPCALPASDGVSKGKIPIGVVPIATSSFNTAGQAGLGTTLGQLSLGTDDAIGGSPMDNGPFSGFNANFDFASLTLFGYNDTTAPVLTLGATSLALSVGDPFDVNNPGVSVTCLDNTDGSDDLTAAAGANPNISFTVDDGNGGSTPPVDTNTAGIYEVLYTCTDNAGARAAIADDPNNQGSPTIPADNTSAATTVLTITVTGAGQPTITITNGSPTAHEACTIYNDAGATWTDPEDGGPFPVTDITDSTPIIGAGNEPNDGSYSIIYNAVDSDLNAALTQTRIVNVADTIGPVITIAGGNTASIESSDEPTYTLPTATAVDANSDCNPVVGGMATTTDTVNFIVPVGQDTSVSTIRYFATDASVAANQTQEDLSVTVARSEPVITLVDGGLVLNVGDTYVEQGMDVHDVQDGDLTAVTTTGVTAGTGAGMGLLTHTIDSSAVDTSTAGGYTVTYDVTDSDGNVAAQVTRDVQVGSFASGSNFTMLDSAGFVFGGTNDVVFEWDETFNTDETDTNFDKMSIFSAKPQPFFSFFWTAHNIRVYDTPGTYTFDTSCTAAQYDAGVTSCGGSTFISMTIPAGGTHIGAHILFDWGKPTGTTPCGVASCDIDVVNVWEIDGVWDQHGDSDPKNKLWDGPAGSAPDPSTTWKLVSTDVNGDGVNASPMVDGPFQGFYANFNAGPGGSLPPPPPYTGSAPDTKLGDSLFVSPVNPWALIAGVMTLFGLRRFSNKKK